VKLEKYTLKPPKKTWLQKYASYPWCLFLPYLWLFPPSPNADVKILIFDLPGLELKLLFKIWLWMMTPANMEYPK